MFHDIGHNVFSLVILLLEQERLMGYIYVEARSEGSQMEFVLCCHFSPSHCYGQLRLT